MSLKKAKLKSKTLLSRLTGFSLPVIGGGLSFKPVEADRTIVRELLTFLEDRRALYVGAIWEQPNHVVQSVLQMRAELTQSLKRLSEGSPAEAACRSMRGACRDFVSAAGSQQLREMHDDFGRSMQGERFLIALGSLRATFGHQIALLAHLYEVDLEEHLASILPPVPDGTA